MDFIVTTTRKAVRMGTQFFEKAEALIMRLPLPPRVHAFIARYWNKGTATALIVIVLFLGFAFTRAFFAHSAGDDAAPVARQVVTAPAGLASSLESVLETTGEVKSQTQGDLRAQSAGVITSVNAHVGQRVAAGTIIASIENASERASVSQARASVAQATAALTKVQGGTRSEQLAVLETNTKNATQALTEAQTAARNTLLSMYATSNATFEGGVDTMFDNADGANPRLVFGSRNSTALTKAEHERFLLQGIIERQVAAANVVSNMNGDKVRAEIDTLEKEMAQMKTALDDLITALDGAIESSTITSATIASYKTTAATARANVLAALTTLSATRGALNSAQNAVTVAKENESQGVTGAQQEDIDVAQSQLDSTQAALAQAIAQLEKTLVRAPVTGVVTILTVNTGDFVTSFQDVGLVANENALEVETYISANAINRIAVGGRALINRTHEGVITSIAPGIDPVKRQVEVHIALTSDSTDLPHGSRVSVEFLNLVNHQSDEEPKKILVPVSALKLVGDEAYVFIVNSESKLEALPVVLGNVVQSSVEISEGIESDTEIVLDARGLNTDDLVVIKN